MAFARNGHSTPVILEIDKKTSLSGAFPKTRSETHIRSNKTGRVRRVLHGVPQRRLNPERPHVHGAYEIERMSNKGAVYIFRNRSERKAFEINVGRSGYSWRELVCDSRGEFKSYRLMTGDMKQAGYTVDRVMSGNVPPIDLKNGRNGTLGISDAWNQLRLALNSPGFMGLKIDQVRRVQSFDGKSYAQEWYWGTSDCREFALALRYDPFRGWARLIKNESRDSYSLVELGYGIEAPKSLVKGYLDNLPKLEVISKKN